MIQDSGFFNKELGVTLESFKSQNEYEYEYETANYQI